MEFIFAAERSNDLSPEICFCCFGWRLNWREFISEVYYELNVKTMDLASTLPKVEKCEHFSIRGYVAKVRKKDRNICWPFPLEEQVQVDVLPPIHVPRFKYWKCTTCVKIAKKENAEESVEVFTGKSGHVPAGAYCHQDVLIPPPGVVDVLLLHSEQSPKEKATGGRLDTSSASIYVIDVEDDMAVGNEVQHDSLEEIYEGQIMADVHTTIDGNDIEKNTLVHRVIKDGSQQASGGHASKGKTANTSLHIHFHPNDDGNSKSVCIDIQENEAEVRIGNDVAAVKNTPFQQLEVDAEKNVNQDAHLSKGHDGTLNYVKEASTLPKAIVGEDKAQLIKDSRIRNPPTKKLSPNRHNLPGKEKHTSKSLPDSRAHKGIDYDSSKNDTVNAVTAPTESDCQTLENEHLMSCVSGTCKRKQKKVRTLGNIISRCDETVAGSSSSGSDVSLGIDLNLSPTHQVVKTKKRKDIGDDADSFEMSSGKTQHVTVECAAKGERQATINNYETVSSYTNKGISIEIGLGVSSRILQYETAPCAQKEIENTQFRNNGTRSVYVTPVKDASSGIVNGKFPLLLPKSPTKRPNILKKPPDRRGGASEWQSNRASEEKGNADSEHAGFDDTPIDIVELMTKHQHERHSSAGGNSNCLSRITTNKGKECSKSNKKEALGHENLKFLEECKFVRSKHQLSKAGSSSTGAKRLRLEDLIQSNEYASQNSSRPGGYNSKPEQARLSKGFTAFNENSSKEALLPVDISSRTCAIDSVTCSKNRKIAASQASILFGCSSGDIGHEKSGVSLNVGKPSNRDRFLFGASCSNKNGNYLNNSFFRNPDKTALGNQSCTYSRNHEDHPTRTQPLFGNLVALSAGRMDPRTCLPSSEGYHTSKPLSRQNPSQHSQSPMRPNSLLPGNSRPQKFAGESIISQQKPHCLQLFPKLNMNGNLSPKSTVLLENHHDKRNWGSVLGTTMGTDPDYHFRDSGRRIPSNLNSIQPVDLYNKESISATRLLRVMDAGMCPCTPIDVDSSQKLSQQSNVLHDHCQLEMSTLGNFRNNECSFLSSLPNYFTKNHHAESLSENLASVPAPNTASVSTPVPAANIGCSAAPVSEVNCVSSPLENSEILKMNHLLRRSFSSKWSPDSLRDHMKGKAIVQDVHTQSKISRLNTFLSDNGRSGKNLESGSIPHLQKELFTPVTMSSHTGTPSLKDSTNRMQCKGKQPEKVSPVKISPMTEVCFMNRNPSEFTIPEAGNKYMIGYGDVKENILSVDGTGIIESVPNKRQKRVRFAEEKEM